MQTVFTPKAGLSGLTETAMVEKGRNLVIRCTGNANVNLPAGFLAKISSACDELETANIQVMENGGRRDVIVRNERRAALATLIRELAGYVQAQCENDPVKIGSTGFEVRRSATPPEKLSAVTNVRAKALAWAGSIAVRWNGAPKRVMYRLYATSGDPNDEGSWTLLASTTKNYFNAFDLKSDTMYYFRVVAVGILGDSPVSEVTNAKAA